MIKLLNSQNYSVGYNQEPGGRISLGFKGHYHTEESKNKLRCVRGALSVEHKMLLSKLLSGENNPRFGKEQSPEGKEKIRAANRARKGWKHSEKSKEAIRTTHLARGMSPEHRKTLSERMTTMNKQRRNRVIIK